MPEPIRSTIPQLFAKVNGSPLPQDAFDAILEGVVECSLHLPDACTIRVHDNDFKWLDSDHWKEGNEIRVEAGQGRDPLIKVFEGEITAVGKGRVLEDGTVRPVDVKVGDRILFGKYSGQTVTVQGDELLVMREEDIMGVVEGK